MFSGNHNTTVTTKVHSQKVLLELQPILRNGANCGAFASFGLALHRCMRMPAITHR